MKTGKWRLLVLVALVGLAVVVSSPPAQAGTAGPKADWQTREYFFGGWPSTAGQYMWAALTWTIIANDTGLRITVVDTAGTEESMHMLQNKKADMANYDAALVKRDFKDKHDLRTIFPFAPAVWQFAVAKDANIKTLKDLDGKKWNPGPAGGGSTFVTMQIMDMLGIKPVLHQATLTDAAEAYSDRQIVGFCYRGTGGDPTSAMVEANAARPVYFVSLSEEEIAKIHAKWPNLNKYVVRARLYPGQNDPFTTIATLTGNAIAASKDMPEEAVYTVVKSYWKNFKNIAKQFPGVSGASPNDVVASEIPLHMGAIKYYEETGIKIPQSLYPPEAKK
ncbi:MAG TPA: TAXI family TRAP transporter solute-binding subunit [Candidatus Methylomirabilis sp.]|nr:TAXI family TRAP transporter solute-binding subunit [Candidatus Methylomirabilis sp.]